MRETFSLNDKLWKLGSVAQQPFGFVNDLDRVREWLPAEVPGDVRLDLLRAGRIPDPYVGDQVNASRWVDGLDWWYVRQLDLEPNDRQRFLVFEGIDYQSLISFNGVELGRHAGMFSRQVYQVPRELCRESSTLAVRVWGSDALPKLELSRAASSLRAGVKRLRPYNEPYPDRLATLKCQMSYGWDFAPRLLTCGIWDQAWLIQTGPAFIRDVWSRGLPDGRVQLSLTIDSTVACAAKVQVSIHGRNFEATEQEFEFELALLPGQADYELQFRLADPHPWNPWDRGHPDLYDLEIELQSDGVLDSTSEVLGLRTIDLEPNPGAPAGEPPWTFVVNGMPEFIRGANWVPADSIPGRLREDDYGALLNLARDANINLLRVWGGGLREKRPFYDLCDKLGILVWQDFPFSGAPLDYARRDPELLALARAECSAIVHSLRGHPSLALWCGGNEHNTMANAKLVQTLREVAAHEDGTRPFKPGSPSAGEAHDWRVWHWGANTRDYRRQTPGFIGEFGLQSAPSAASLTHFIPSGQLWPPGPLWSFHNAELDKLKHYARAIGPIGSLDEFVAASQVAQLRGLQVMIEHSRRNKGRTGGVLFWQFDEPWPAVCWSIIDYFRTPKPAYDKLRELYNPILVSFYYGLRPRRPGDQVRGELWIVNDTLRAVSGRWTAHLEGVAVDGGNFEIGPNTAHTCAALALTLGTGENRLTFAVVSDGVVLSTNEYDLNYCDRGEILPLVSPLQKFAARLQT